LQATLVAGDHGDSSKTSTIATPTVSGACATVSSLSAAFVAASPSGRFRESPPDQDSNLTANIATPTVPAQIAFECLNSVPLNTSAALALVDAIEPYLEWQSDSAWLKDPPAVIIFFLLYSLKKSLLSFQANGSKSYFYPPVDIFGNLAAVKANLQANVYTNEYGFQKDLYQVFAPAHDGHYVVYPDLLAKALQYGRQLAIVSISKDGKETPKIYSYADVIADVNTASEIKKINGIDASKYLIDWASTASFNQDAVRMVERANSLFLLFRNGLSYKTSKRNFPLGYNSLNCLGLKRLAYGSLD
jgi:hypothetical protein